MPADAFAAPAPGRIAEGENVGFFRQEEKIA